MTIWLVFQNPVTYGPGIVIPIVTYVANCIGKHIRSYVPIILLCSYNVSKCMLQLVLFVCKETKLVYHIATIILDQCLPCSYMV